jgi:hypothetical protein
MGAISSHVVTRKGRLLPHSALGAAVERRAGQVAELIGERRRIALKLRRTQDERSRLELERLDNELVKYRIDIPAVQQRRAMSHH